MALLLALGLGLARVSAAADDYPSRPVTVIVPYSPGGNTDVMARAFLGVMQKTMGLSSIVTNREGAGGTVGFGVLHAARPDGYTLVFSASSPLSSASHLVKLPYAYDDFAPVCQVFENIFAIAVAPKSKYQTLNQLIDDAKARPGQVYFGSSGIASIGHLAGEGFGHDVGVKFVHVPFRGDGQMVPQLLGGQIDFTIAGMGSTAASLRPLAVFSDKRLPFYPDVPTTTELGFPTSPPGYQGLFAPKGTPPAVMAALQKGCEAAVDSDEFKAVGVRLSQKIMYVDSAGFAQRIAADYKYKGDVIKALGITPE